MTTVTCALTIPASATNGGKLQGTGFGAVTPRLNGGDRIQVVVTWGGNNPPDSLNGYFMCSAAANAGSNQSAPSPFLNGSNYVCYTRLLAKKGAQGQQYTFGSFEVPSGAAAGNYELTLVVEDTRTTPSTQWSEDPEFDTSGE